MRRMIFAFVVLALTVVAAPSRAAFTTHLDALTADVDGRIAELAGTLTKQQKAEKAHLTALSKTLHKKSTSLTTDLKIAVAAAKIVKKSFSADAAIDGGLATALDGFYADVLAEYDALATALGLPQKSGVEAAIKAFNKAGGSLDDAIQEGVGAYEKAKAEEKAHAAVAAGDKALPPSIRVTPSALDFGTVSLGAEAKPQTITILNLVSDAVVVEVYFDEADAKEGFFVEGGEDEIIAPGHPLNLTVGFSGEKPGPAEAQLHLRGARLLGSHETKLEVKCTGRVK